MWKIWDARFSGRDIWHNIYIYIYITNVDKLNLVRRSGENDYDDVEVYKRTFDGGQDGVTA